MPFIFGGVILIVIGIGLFFARKSQQGKLKQMSSTETSTSEQLTSAAGSRPGGFKDFVEVKGAIRCDKPLVSELSERECVYCRTSLVRRYEETYYEKDDKTGERVARTRTGDATVSSSTESTPFWVEDATGRILVDPEGADIEPIRSLNRLLDPEEVEFTGKEVSIGKFSLQLGVNFSIDDGKRTLGYQQDEYILPVDRDVYVLGEASNASGSLKIQKPTEKGSTFLISHKSEEELIKSTGSKLQWMLAGAIACDAIGVAMVVLGALRR